MDTRTIFSPAQHEEPLDSSTKAHDNRRRHRAERTHQATRRTFNGEAETSDSDKDKVHPLYAFGRQWAPLVVPLLVVGVSLTLALLLAVCGWAQIDRVSIASIPLVYLLALGGGVALAYALYFADDETTLLATGIAGSALLMATLLSAVAGMLLGIVVIAACALALVWHVHRHLCKVAPASLLVTQLQGRYLRTLPPGLYIRLPGERIAATLETREHRYMTPTRTVEVEAEDGTRYSARAAATVGYAVDPDLVYRVLPKLNTWERDMQASVDSVLLECLARWAWAMVCGEDVPDDALAHATLTELRERAQAFGVRILSVRIRNIQLGPLDVSAGSDAGHPLYMMEQGTGMSVSHDTPTITDQTPLYAPMTAGTPAYAHAYSPRAQTEREQMVAPVPAILAPVDAEVAEEGRPSSMTISPDALAATYSAIRERRITDPATIRMVAQAFARLSQDPSMSDSLPFDAASAARILTEYAGRLDR